MMQMLMRYRNAKRRAVTVQASTTDNLITDADTLYEATIRRYQGTAQAVMGNAAPLSTALREGARLMAAFTADDNLQRANVQATFRFLAETTGFRIKTVTSEAPKMRKLLQQAREALIDHIKSQVLTATPISKDRMDILRKTGADITHEIRFGYERWKIEDLVGWEINEQLYDDLHKQQSRAALRLFAALSVQPYHLHNIDRTEINTCVWLPKRQHLTRRVEIVQTLLKRVFPQGLDACEELTAEEISERLGDLDAVLADMRLYFDDRRDYSEKAVPVLRRVLSKVGLKLISKQIQCDGKRFMVYWIDQEHLAKWRRYAQQVNRPKNTENDDIISVNLGVYEDDAPNLAVMAMNLPPDTGWMAEIEF
ncbi:MAG: hypothetical protein D6711_16875 [Chloroflexi bacterium]|nr:MAG: hypothetical protein D6711_16875 [Chloroflexota bacterium]